MPLFVKELCSARYAEPIRSWIHPSGDAALLFEPTSELSAEDWSSAQRWLGEQAAVAPAALRDFAAALADAAPFVRSAKALAFVATDGTRLHWLTRGQAFVVRVAIKVHTASAKHRPEGSSPPELMPEAGEGDCSDDYVYLLASSGVTPKLLRKQRFDDADSGPYVAFEHALAAASDGRPWRAFLCPAESRSSYANPHWSRIRFVGSQEGRTHELWGLRAIANVLDVCPDFAGSVILGGQSVRSGEGTTLGDGVLLCPYGAFLLEAKHWSGHWIVEPYNDNAPIVQLVRRGDRRRHNPLRALEAAAREFAGQHKTALDKWVGVLLVFTHPSASIECVDRAGTRHPDCYDAGDAIVCMAPRLAEAIRSMAARRQTRLAEHQIAAFVDAHGPKLAPTAPGEDVPRPLRIGRFVIMPEPIAEESTPYCDVLDVTVDGRDRRLWAKRYRLNPLCADMNAEAERVGREVRALQDLSGEQGFYKYIDRFNEGQLLYVIVDRVEGLKLDQWLAHEHPSRERRLTVLRRLAYLLGRLAELDIVHRALSPAAVRIGERDSVTVVNFDFCQLGHLATIEQRARSGLAPAFLSQEAATPGCKLTPGDDTFSFGKLVCLVLTGELPFETPGIAPLFLTRPALWQQYADKHGLLADELTGIRSLLAQMRERRPIGAALVDLMDRWQ